MNEHLLQFIWQHLYFNRDQLVTTNDEPVQIITQGFLNHNQGPDFLEARIKINDVLWAGNAELHLRSSDWQKHQHDDDPHYQNVILHVVYEHDVATPSSVPVLELKGRISKNLLKYYHDLMQEQRFVPCSGLLAEVPSIVWQNWKERMLAERLLQKSEHIHHILERTNRHWEEAFWQLLARNFGLPLNGDAFEAIAAGLPVTLLAKHKNQLLQVEALLLGQAGLLEKEFTEQYPIILQKEYRFLQSKHKLKPVPVLLHFLRMRPSNFPSIRLAQLASLIHESSHLFSKITEATSLEALRKMFAVTANDYWHYHYVFDEESPFRKKNLGESMINNLLINTVLPLLFVYASEQNNNQMKERSIQWLQQLPKEKNSVTVKWEQAGAAHQSAFDSQALLYLKKNYCDARHCLQCAVGNNLLKQKITS